MTFARLLDIKPNTTRYIINRYLKTKEITSGARGGSKGKLSEKSKEHLLNSLYKNLFISLSDIIESLKKKTGTICCKATISNFLNGQMITFKSCRGAVEAKNSLRVRMLRKDCEEIPFRKM